MHRRLFTAAAVLSLLPGLATVALWVRSYFAFDSIWYNELQNHVTEFYASEGELGYMWARTWSNADFESTDRFGHASKPPSAMGEGLRAIPGGWFRIGFGYGHAIGRHENTVFVLVPLWAATFTTATASVLCLMLLRRGARRMRRQVGGCANCGYNLTGNASGVCPECGTAIAPHAEAA